MIQLGKLLSLSLLLTLYSCESDELDAGGGSGGGGSEPTEKTFSAQLNGEAYTASGQDFIQGNSQSTTGVIVWTAAGVRSNLSTAETILVTVVSIDSADFAAGSIFSSENPAFNGYSTGTYGIESPTFDASATVPDSPSIPSIVTITEVNEAEQTWSATFSFEAVDDDGNVYLVQNGEFSNVPYE